MYRIPGNFRGRKPSRNRWNWTFRRENFRGSMACGWGACARPSKFAEKTFANGPKSAKFSSSKVSRYTVYSWNMLSKQYCYNYSTTLVIIPLSPMVSLLSPFVSLASQISPAFSDSFVSLLSLDSLVSLVYLVWLDSLVSLVSLDSLVSVVSFGSLVS